MIRTNFSPEYLNYKKSILKEQLVAFESFID